MCKNSSLTSAQLSVFVTTLTSVCNADLIQLQERGRLCTSSAESLAKLHAIQTYATDKIAETERTPSW